MSHLLQIVLMDDRPIPRWNDVISFGASQSEGQLVRISGYVSTCNPQSHNSASPAADLSDLCDLRLWAGGSSKPETRSPFRQPPSELRISEQGSRNKMLSPVGSGLKMLQLNVHVCPRIPFRQGLQATARGPHAGVVYAAGRPLHVGVSCCPQTIFADRDLQKARGRGRGNDHRRGGSWCGCCDYLR